MSNALTYFANTIANSIPMQILDLALVRESDNQFRLPQNLDTLIRHRILSRLVTDMNLSRGMEIRFNIKECVVQNIGENFTLLQVPEHILNGRSLISITGFIDNYGSTTISPNPQEQLLAHLSNPSSYMTGNLEVVSRNEFFIYKEFMGLQGMVEATVSYSEELREINPRYYMAFSKIAILCAKAYIYNTLIVKLGQGSIYYGQEIPIVSQIVESYSDANEEYMEEMNVRGSKMLMMNDKTSNMDYFRLLSGG